MKNKNKVVLDSALRRSLAGGNPALNTGYLHDKSRFWQAVVLIWMRVPILLRANDGRCYSSFKTVPVNILSLGGGGLSVIISVIDRIACTDKQETSIKLLVARWEQFADLILILTRYDCC